jgi:SUKH-4 immunity protein
MLIPPETLRHWQISEADKLALADLPDAVRPFFQGDPQKETEPVMRGGYYRIANDLGRDIGVGMRGVFAVDPLNEMPDCFVNSSVADLVVFLQELGAYQDASAAMDYDEAEARATEVRERLERHDPAAFAGHAWWALVFDQLEHGY